MADIKLKFNKEARYYDIDFLDGDFELCFDLETAILMSIFCEARADEDLIIKPELRRGHFTNQFSRVENYEVGSLFWLYSEQQNNTEENALDLEDAIKQGLEWLIEDKILADIDVAVVIENSFAYITITTTSNQELEQQYNIVAKIGF